MPPYRADDHLAALASEAFTALRPLQRDALEAAHALATTHDLAIEMPTGSGKTLVALMLAAEAMSEGGSAVYLTGTVHLSNQVTEEAARLGLIADAIAAPLDAVQGRRIRNVERGTALAVMNYWAYFSERELFDPPRLLIIDDAHLLESALIGRYAIDLTRRDNNDLVEDIFEEISARAPGYSVVDDVVSGAHQPSEMTQLLAFPHVMTLVQPVRRLLDEATAGTNLRWSYQRIRDQLAQCLWLVSQHGIQIRPLRFPMHAEARFAAAGRRLFMSATIGDLTDLRRRLGTERIHRIPLASTGLGSTGRRFFVLADNPVDEAALHAERARWRRATSRRVWFCRSLHEAHALEDDFAGSAASVQILSRLGEEMETFAASNDADLIVAGRYDGIDFAHETSRLAVFPSPPYGVDPFDDFLTANFGRASYLNARIAERLTQALGRMTRGEEDWAVVVLESASLTHTLVRRDVSMYLPDDLWAELEEAFERLDRGFEASLDTAESLLSGDGAFPTSTSRERLTLTRPEWSDDLADLEARFGDSILSGIYDAAVPAANALLDRLGDHPLRPWWLYLKGMAEHLSFLQDANVSRGRAALVSVQGAVRAAGRTAWLARVEASTALLRLRRSTPGDLRHPTVEFAARFASTAAYEAWKRATAQGLRSAVHDEVCSAWTQVGVALGFEASEPLGPAATDSLWRSGSARYVFEAKVEHAPQTLLSRRDVNQLLGQMEQEALAGSRVFGAFLTHLGGYHPAADAVADRISILPLEIAYEVWRRLERLLDSWREALAAGHDAELQPPDEWLTELLDRARGRVITPEDLNRAWP